jgi:hypothetical protein
VASTLDILRLRLGNQGLARPPFRRAEEVAAWFVAVQAQDYLGSLWALGLRMRRTTEEAVEAAETCRAIVRTWPMRGTLHFVAAADAKWVTELLAPRVIARNAARIQREVGVDARVIGRARAVVQAELQGGKRLERGVLYEALEARRIGTANSRGLHILGWLAMEGTLCLAGRSGKQQTFALLDEWAAGARRLDREAALAELATRYFASHGPATHRDFMWWTGLQAKEARDAIHHAAGQLARLNIDGRDYWWRERRSATTPTPKPLVRLLPAFDEYAVGYHDRVALAGTSRLSKSGLLGPSLLIDGSIAGTWKRTLEKQGVRIDVCPSRTLTSAERRALHEQARHYGAFLGLAVDLRLRSSP